MRTVFLLSFLRDVKKIRDGKRRARIATVIEQVEAAEGIQDNPQSKPLSGRHG